MFTTRKFLRTLHQNGIQNENISISKDYSDIFRHNPNDVEIFKAIGFTNVFSIDVSPYEGADFVLDLNKPLPQNFNKKFDFIIKTPPASFLIKEAIKLKSGSKEPGRNIAGSITKAQLKKIAEIKMKDLNAFDIEQAIKIIAGSARSMGVEVKD